MCHFVGTRLCDLGPSSPALDGPFLVSPPNASYYYCRASVHAPSGQLQAPEETFNILILILVI